MSLSSLCYVERQHNLGLFRALNMYNIHGTPEMHLFIAGKCTI